MDDHSFNDTYQAESDAASQSESIDLSASGRWHTTNTSNTTKLEYHLPATAVSRDVRASSNPSLRHDESDSLDSTNMVSTQSERRFYENDDTRLTSDRVRDSREQTEFVASMPGQSPSQVIGDHSKYGDLEVRDDAGEEIQSEKKMSTPPLRSNFMGPRVSRGPDHSYATSEQQEPANPMPATDVNEKEENFPTSRSTEQRRSASGRLDSEHLMSTSELERRGRSPSPRPKVSAETKARWAMLKQLAGVSQPHDMEEGDVKRHPDEETRTTEAEIRVREEASVRDSSQIDKGADDASIERYLQKLQGDPHIDSRGLQEGLSRMHSNQNPKSQQDQSLAHENRFENDTHPGPQGLSDSNIRGVENTMRKGGQDARNMLHKGEGQVEQTIRGHEAAALKRDEHAFGADLEKAGRRVEGELRSASSDARGHFQKDKQGIERSVRKDTNIADAEMHKLGGRTAREFRKAENGLQAGLQGAATAAESLLPRSNIRQDLQRGVHDLVKDVHKAENAASRTALGLEVRRGERDLMGEVHKVEHEISHIGLGQEIRKGEADLMGEVHKAEHKISHIGLGQEIRKGEADLIGDIHKAENKLANTGLGHEARKGEHHLMNGFRKLEHELPHLGLGQDLRTGEHDLKKSLQEAAGHLSRDEHALVRGAEAAGRSVERGLEHTGRLAVEGTAIVGGLGLMALDHAASGNRASTSRPKVPHSGRGIVHPTSQHIPSNFHQPNAGIHQASEAPGLHPATIDRRPNQPPANDRYRPAIVEPSRHSPVPQMSQPGHNRGPSGSQQPHLSPSPSPAKTPSPGSAANKNLLGKMPNPSPENNQRSQAPVRKSVLPPGPQEALQQRPPTAVLPHSQSQRPQGAAQHPPDAQPHPSHTESLQPPPARPQGAPQHPQNTVSQHRPPQHAMKSPQHTPNAMLQHHQVPNSQRVSQQVQLPNIRPQHLQTSQLQKGSQRSQPPRAVSQQPQNPHSQGSLQQRQPAKVQPQHPQPPEALQQGQLANSKLQQRQAPLGAPKQRSQSRMPPDTQHPHPQQPLQQRSQDPTPSHLLVSQSPGAPQQQPQPLRDGQAQQSEAISNSNAQQAKPALLGATIGLHPARIPIRPRSDDRPNSEGKTDEEEPRASIMQQRKRGAIESQRRLAERQERENGNDGRHEDQAAECYAHQTERHSTMEHAAEPHVVSGPQSMLNMFKARADAAIEASGDSPSFTDQMVQLLCSMAQDAMPEVERRLAQNQRQHYS